MSEEASHVLSWFSRFESARPWCLQLQHRRFSALFHRTCFSQHNLVFRVHARQAPTPVHVRRALEAVEVHRWILHDFLVVRSSTDKARTCPCASCT
jgi:hypothetical protein